MLIPRETLRWSLWHMLVMNESAEVRAATRGIIGYDSDEQIANMVAQHEEAVSEFERLLEVVRPTMVSKEGHACMEAIDKAWAEYKQIDAQVAHGGNNRYGTMHESTGTDGGGSSTQVSGPG